MEVPTSLCRADREFDRFMGILEAYILRDGENCILSVDTETNAEDIRDGRGYCQGISLAFRFLSTPTVVYLPIRHIDSENNLSQDRLERLRRVIETFTGWLVFHNAKFDLVSLRTVGISYSGKFYCTMIMCHLINENFPMDKSLNSCVKTYVDKMESKKESVVFQKLKEILGWANIRSDDMREYAEWDAVITLMLWEAIIKKFKAEVPEAYWQHKQDFHHVVITMEARGIHIDEKLCVEQSQIGIDRMTELTKELKINPASPTGLKKLLIDQLGLPVVKLTKAGIAKRKAGETFDEKNYASFDKEAMGIYDEILEREDSPIAKRITEYRG